MHGTTGDYKQEYKSKIKADRAAENIRLLGYDVDVKKMAKKDGAKQ